MRRSLSRSICLALGMTAMVALAGCSNYVKRSEFNDTVAKLQSTDQNLQQQMDSLKQAMQQKFAKYDAKISELDGRIQVDTVAHFGFNQSTLNDSDKPMLNEFAKVMREHHPDALVTVEGFTDPAGSVAYNKHLGMQRADAVRNYLVSQGMASDSVRAVSYGKASNRLVKKGASGASGSVNRRVSLAIDFAGDNGNGTSAS